MRRSDLTSAIEHAETRAAIEVERSYLEALEAGCALPIGGYVSIVDGLIHAWWIGEIEEELKQGKAFELEVARGQPLSERTTEYGIGMANWVRTS